MFPGCAIVRSVSHCVRPIVPDAPVHTMAREMSAGKRTRSPGDPPQGETENNAPIGDETAEEENELEGSFWALVSRCECLFRDLTYLQAAEKMQELTRREERGICIVTNAAADRLEPRGE